MEPSKNPTVCSQEAERTEWLKNFDAPPEPLSAEEKSTFLKGRCWGVGFRVYGVEGLGGF